MLLPDARALNVYCWADGSGFGWRSPGGARFPRTGYFDECPYLTVDVDIDGKIIDVGFALDTPNGKLEKDIECSLVRYVEERWMIWTLSFPQGSLLICDEQETWHAVGDLANTLSATLVPQHEMVTLSIKSGKLSA